MLPTLHTGGLSYLGKVNGRNLLIDKSLYLFFSLQPQVFARFLIGTSVSEIFKSISLSWCYIIDT
jgi:hypothetical protein